MSVVIYVDNRSEFGGDDLELVHGISDGVAGQRYRYDFNSRSATRD
jgi:hypothetical protein